MKTIIDQEIDAGVSRVLLPPRGHLADGNCAVRHPAERGAWVWHPEKRATETAILRFRLRFHLATASSPLLHVTADQRIAAATAVQPVVAVEPV